MAVFKAVITVTVMTDDFDLANDFQTNLAGMSLGDIDNATDNAWIGAHALTSIEEVPPDKVREELISLGNDGDFLSIYRG